MLLIGLQDLLDLLLRGMGTLREHVRALMLQVVEAFAAAQESAATELPRRMQGGEDHAGVSSAPLPFGPTEKQHFFVMMDTWIPPHPKSWALMQAHQSGNCISVAQPLKETTGSGQPNEQFCHHGQPMAHLLMMPGGEYRMPRTPLACGLDP